MNKSILVGDVGSTKSSWWLSGTQNRHITLGGFNPLTHSSEAGKELVGLLKTQLEEEIPSEIWYYGAGVVEVQAADLVRNLLGIHFHNSIIHISSDLEGAARAACGKSAGTVALIGTGSHAAVFDGHHILRQANALGYILGDEGG